MQFTLRINSVNDNPAVSEIRGVKVPRGTQTADIPFTVGDVETPADFLVPTVNRVFNERDINGQPVSEPGTVLLPSNVFFGGAGANRTVTVFPKAGGPSGTSGSADIEVRVADLDAGNTLRTFLGLQSLGWSADHHTTGRPEYR
jgi:hypothetical protein